MNTERAILTKRIKVLTERHNNLTRGRMIPPPKAIRLRNEILALKTQIDAIDRETANRLALEKAPIGDVLSVIAIPLLADIMNDIVADVDGMLCRNGCQ